MAVETEGGFDLGTISHTGDVEFQGDGNKVTVFYTAHDGLDHRILIKEFEAAFRARIELKQIHTRKITSNNTSVGSGYIFA